MRSRRAGSARGTTRAARNKRQTREAHDTGGASKKSKKKRGLAVAVVAFAALWPLLHRAVVYRYDVNPWKLGGWAMYTTPTPPVMVALLGKSDAGYTVIDDRRLPPHVRQQLARFRVARHALGRLRRPDDLAAAVLGSRGAPDAIAVVVQRMSLDPASARMTATKNVYEYDRASLGL